jgi:hypothetical protein
VERKIFWITFTVLGTIADFVLPLWWELVDCLSQWVVLGLASIMPFQNS